VKYILILFVLFEYFTAKKGHDELEKDDKEIMIQDAKAKKEKWKKRLILSSILYDSVFV
jgi:hypothetical protein